MLISKHALKKFNLLIGEQKEIMERKFLMEFILPGTYTIKWHYGIMLKDISLFAGRCRNFDATILGFESHADSAIPFYCCIEEDYNLKTYPDWWNLAIENMKSFGVLDMIIPTIDIPTEILNRYYGK